MSSHTFSERLALSPIGIIHTDFKEREGTPIQASSKRSGKGCVEVYDEYLDGLSDIGGFSHIILIYWFHRSRGFELKVRPYLDSEKRGIFSTRAPRRPNPLGISTVSVEKVEGNFISISGVDMLDGSPLFDIKPYVPQMDDRPGARIGWLEGKVEHMHDALDDGRFDGE